MNWKDFETIIATELRRKYEDTPNELQKADFLNRIRQAKEEMLKLKRGENIDYSIPYMGEAYAIYYHMQRVDNLYLALSEINKTHQLTDTEKVLDIGSGTGSGSTAVCYWVNQNKESTSSRTVEVYAVERAEPMSKMAGSLMRNLRQGVSKNRLNFLHYPLSDTQIAIDRLRNGIFDLILFSYTFDVYDAEKYSEVMARVLRLTRKLHQNGVALFLTPNPSAVSSAKVEFTQKLIDFLKSKGMVTLPISIRRGQHSCPLKRPPILKDLCEFLNSECERLGLQTIYTTQDDLPWYGFYCQCAALTWRTR